MYKNSITELTQILHSDVPELHFDKNNFIKYYNNLTLLEKFNLSLDFMCNRWFTEEVTEHVEIKNSLNLWMNILGVN